ncbi:isopenicillin N synthase family dioxygenase [Aspergillus foveolatus]|uniref:isopenicillin N synthase family dioxygenase n=1 Tax=Aspergillus foveolatus TaxID=210207 RepID=UPI003CCE1A8E
MELPVVDFSSWHNAKDERSRQRVAQQLVDACQRVGFVRIINHSLPEGVLDKAFEWMKRLFALPEEDKMKAPHPAGWAVHRGYSWPGLEKVTQIMSTNDDGDVKKKLREVPDVKEVYDIGSEDDTSQPNQWLPDAILPGFRDFMVQFYSECDRVGKEILRAVAVGLDLEDAEYLTRKHSGNSNQLRLLHYLPVSAEDLEKDRVTRCAAHTDWSSITMLFQDDCGGLEVEDISRPGTFVPAQPVKDSIIMNIGDLLQRWSNDRLRSTNHRVSLPKLLDRIEGPDRMARERFSIPYFMSPDDEVLVECIPSCMNDETPAKYEPITRGDYNKMRMSMMY